VALYTDESIERVRQAVDMLDLVGAKTELRRSGSQWMGTCPFHDERTPSFSVNAADKVFHCFGCGEGGDIFKFVQLTDGLPFRESLEQLADRYGVTLELADEDPQAAEKRQHRDRLLELLERTATWYVRQLWETDEARGPREYLAERGLEEQALREFRVGYAPSAWDAVLVGLRRAGFSERDLWDAGLVRRSQKGGLYDFFRRRVQFPLCDARGRVLGFGGRAVGPDQKPKYVNSTDNVVFHKGRNLFGADLARVAAAKASEVVLCEGYTDVIALHQAGLRNTVGLMGTALTEDQVGELARLAPVVLLALDADSAGQEAMLRAAKVAAGRRLELRVVVLPTGQDPADLLLTEGPDGMRERVAASVPFVRFRVDRVLASEDLGSAEGKDRAVEELRPVLGPLPASALRDELLAHASDRLDVVPVKLAEWLAQPPRGGAAQAMTRRGVPAEPAPQSAPAAPPARTIVSPSARVERSFLIQCLVLPQEGRAALATLDLELDILTPVYRRAALLLMEQLGGQLQAPEGDEELASTLAELQVRSARAQSSRAALEAERLRLELASLERRIQSAKTGGGGNIVELAQRREELQSLMERELEETLLQTKHTD